MICAFWDFMISLAYGSLASVGHLAWPGDVSTFRYIPSQCAAHNGSIIWAWLTQAFVTFRHITAACYGHCQVKPAVTFRNIPPDSTPVLQYTCTISQAYGKHKLPLWYACTIGSAYVTDRLSLWYVCTLVRLFHGTPVPLAQLMGGISQAYGTPVLEYVCTIMRLKAYADKEICR